MICNKCGSEYKKLFDCNENEILDCDCEGKKFDVGKLRHDLFPPDVLEKITEVLTHGAEKYGAFNWQKLDDFNDRYYAATLRHLFTWRRGEKIDKDSGLSHLAHCATNLVFLLWKELNE